MACLQIFVSGLSPALRLHSGLTLCRRPAATATIPLRCRLQENAGDSNGEEPPESLFMKELKRRGMTPASLLEDVEGFSYERGEEEAASKDENGGRGVAKGRTKRNGVAAVDYQRGTLGKRERSIALNSVSIVGMIPQSKLLLSIGGTFFMGFWLLMLITITAFSCLYFFLGSSFVHDASKAPVSLSPYIDPNQLLEDGRISQLFQM